MTTPAEVIARVLREPNYRLIARQRAEAILSALASAGYAVVPVNDAKETATDFYWLLEKGSTSTTPTYAGNLGRNDGSEHEYPDLVTNSPQQAKRFLRKDDAEFEGAARHDGPWKAVEHGFERLAAIDAALAADTGRKG